MQYTDYIRASYITPDIPAWSDSEGSGNPTGSTRYRGPKPKTFAATGERHEDDSADDKALDHHGIAVVPFNGKKGSTGTAVQVPGPHQSAELITFQDGASPEVADKASSAFATGRASLKRFTDVQRECVVNAGSLSGPSKYAALSYVWGRKLQKVLLTNASAARLYTTGFLSVVRGLSKTTRDAITVCKDLGIPLLWLNVMHPIYEEAAFTIVDLDGENTDHRLVGVSDEGRAERQVMVRIQGLQRLVEEPELWFPLAAAYWPIRAWTYQEHFLVAFSAVLGALKRAKFTDKFTFGLPVSYFDAVLLWRRSDPSERASSRRRPISRGREGEARVKFLTKGSSEDMETMGAVLELEANVAAFKLALPGPEDSGDEENNGDYDGEDVEGDTSPTAYFCFRLAAAAGTAGPKAQLFGTMPGMLSVAALFSNCADCLKYGYALVHGPHPLMAGLINELANLVIKFMLGEIS
ncbi:hypothetical protein DL765_010079 [Monosporascus sp. GIB2]|nr:hypothetical protein DL765_010079 [Monosporascus sp. GIB2]